MNPGKRGKNKYIQAGLLCLLMLAAGSLICFLALVVAGPGEAADSFLRMLRSFFGQSNSGASLCVFLNETACLYISSLGVILCSFSGAVPTAALAECVIGAGACACMTGKLLLPRWSALALSVLSGAFLGALHGIYASKGKSSGMAAGVMLDFMAILLAPLLLGNVGRQAPVLPVMLSLSGMNGQIGIETAIAVFCGLGILLLMRSRAGMVIRSSGANCDEIVYDGFPSRLIMTAAMALAGALASLGAALLVLKGYQTDVFTYVSMGTAAIGAACLGLFHPIAAVLSSSVVQYMVIGSAVIIDHPAAALLPDLFSAVCICVYALRSQLFKHVRKGWEQAW